MSETQENNNDNYSQSPIEQTSTHSVVYAQLLSTNQRYSSCYSTTLTTLYTGCSIEVTVITKEMTVIPQRRCFRLIYRAKELTC